MSTVTVPRAWADGTPLTSDERLRIALLRLAGCTCTLPLLGHTSGDVRSGPRCRLCNVRAEIAEAGRVDEPS
jgi:hypothetical protein